MAFDPTNATAVTIAGIFPAWDEGTKEHYAVRGGATAVRTVVCEWSRRGAMIQQLIGVATGSGVNLTVNPGERYPDATWMAVGEADVEGVGIMNNDGMMIGYQYARITVTYKNIDFTLGPAGGGSFQLEIGQDAIVLSTGSDPVFKWEGVDEDLLPEITPPLLIGTALICVPQSSIPDFYTKTYGSVLNIVSKVNAAPLFGAPKGTIIYRGASALGRLTPNGIEVHDLGHRLEWREQEWNKFFDPKRSVWDYIQLKHTTQRYFVEADLSLFQPQSLQPGGGITGL